MPAGPEPEPLETNVGLSILALAASLAAGSCPWTPSALPAFDGDLAQSIARFQDIPPAQRKRLQERLASHRFDERVLIRRDAIIGRQRYASTLTGLQLGERQVCAQADRSDWSAATEVAALSYCEGMQCILVTLEGRHTARAIRLPDGATAADAQALLDAQPTAAGEAPAYAPGRLIVASRAGLSEAALAAIVGNHGGKSRRMGRKSSLYLVELPVGREADVAALLARHPQLKFVERDQRVKPAYTANDPYLGSEWHLSKIGAAQAWDSAQGSGVTIAILDSGVNASHPDLSGRLVAGWNFYDGNSSTADVLGHGTAVAGAAAATLNNGAGVAGVAGQARIMPLRITDTSGYALYSTMAQALTWAADQGARVANISYAASGSTSVQNASAYMKSKGGLVVVAAGNNGVAESTAPTTSLITVSATDANDVKTSWSSYGSFVSIAAPGQDIWTTSQGGGYQAWWGTSLASPVVAGVLGLMMSARPALSAAQVEGLLFSTAVDLGAAGRDTLYGYGRVNAAAAVQASLSAQASDTQAPSVSISAPQAYASVSGLVAVDVTASDNVGVSRVDLLANGTVVASDSGTPYAFSWDSSTVSNGSVSLVARAYDAAGNNSSSSTVSVTVANAVAADTSPPSLAISSPAANSTVSGTVSIKTSASDDGGSSGISQSLYLDGKLVASGSGASLSYSWNTRKSSSGSHTIQAVARDAAGNSRTLSIQVNK